MFNAHLQSWQKLRKEIDSCDLSTGLEKTNSFWSSAPFTPYYLDYNDPARWPDPWTLVSENVFCDLAKALSIMYTVYFSEHKSNIDIELRVYKCTETGYEYNLVWVDGGKYILNYSNSVVNKEQVLQSLKLLKKYSATDIGLDKY
jgi:hypothetical protein